MPAKHWYLVYSKPQQESVAQTNLARQGYEIYLPRIRQITRRHGRQITTIRPMFPRYLFIRLDSGSDNWGPIRSTLGVVSLVRFGQHAAQVPDNLVAMLRQREGEEGVHAVPAPEYRPGNRVRINEGSFAGYEGIFVTKSGRDRVVLLLEILGHYTRAVVDAGAIEPDR